MKKSICEMPVVRGLLTLFFFVATFFSLAQPVCNLNGAGEPMAPADPGNFSIASSEPDERDNNSIKLTWSVSSNADKYVVRYRVSGVTAWTIGPVIGDGTSDAIAESATVEGLSSNTTYDFKIESENTCQYCAPNCVREASSNETGIVHIKTAPAVPAIPATIQVYQTKFIAAWTAPPSPSGVARYRLDVSENSEFPGLVSGYSNRDVGNVTSFEVTGLSSGNTYWYRVRSVNSDGSASESSAPKKVVLLPATPSLTSANTITQASFNARWTAVTADEGTIRYQLLIDNTNDMSSPLKTISNITSTNKAITTADIPDLTPGATYYYKVKATNNGSYDNASAQASAMGAVLLPATPSLQAATGMTTTAFTANWSAVTTSGGTVTYQLLVDDNNGFSSPVSFEVGSVTSKTITSENIPGWLVPSATLYYKVKATNNGAFTHAGVQVTPITVHTLPVAPALLAPTLIGQTSFQANWSAVVSPGTLSYKLEIDNDSDFSSLLYDQNVGNVTEKQITSAEIPSLAPGNTYYYKVKATNNGDFTHSEIQAVPVSVPTIPAGPQLTGTADQTSLRLQWNPVTGASNYRLDVASDNAFTKKLPGLDNVEVTETAITIQDLLPGAVYFSRIRSENNSGLSDYSAVMEVATIPATPDQPVASDVGSSALQLSWNMVAGTENYRIDVSTDDRFETLLPGYADFPVTGTTSQVSGLREGTHYYFRVRSENASGLSPYSEFSSAITRPAAPELQASAAQTSITLRWNVVTGASNYRLDVSADEAFTGMLDGFSDVSLEQTTIAIHNLQPGKVCFARIRAENNAGLSAYSATKAIITIPSAPTQPVAASITIAATDISWKAVEGARNYRLDVSTENSFSSALRDYNNLPVNGLTQRVTGLNPGARYYFRVRSENESGTSPASVTSSAITLPEIPSHLSSTGITASSFIASWQAVTGADFYELEVSRNNTFTDLIQGYNPKVILNTLEEAVVALSPSVVYYWRVRAANASGASANSLIKVVPTLAPDGRNNFDVSINRITYNPEYAAPQNLITIEASAYFFPTSIRLFYRPVTHRDYKHVTVTVENEAQLSELRWTIQEDWLDEIGCEFYFTIEDAADQKKESAKNLVRREVSNWTLPVQQFGSSVKEYQIVSSPYLLDNSIEDMFEPIMGAYDPVQWRFVRYQNKKNVDYADGLSKTRMERGKGYWFLSRKAVNLQFAGGKTPDNTTGKPFVLHLEPGWNQIGNPFPFPLDWEDVVSQNGDLPGVGSLKVYDGTMEGFVESTVLDVFGGGFVRADNAIDITIPVTSRYIPGGRRPPRDLPENKIDDPSWIVPLTIVQGGCVNTLGGFGMHPLAATTKDRFDEMTLPRFVNYLEFNSKHPEYFLPDFAKDIVATANQYTWRFQAEYNQSGPVCLKWDRQALRLSKSALLLHDLDRNILIDMKQDSAYCASGSRSFKVYYNNTVSHREGNFQLGAPYPNPAEDLVTIPYAFLNLEGENAAAFMKVADVTGKVILEKEYRSSGGSTGLQSIQWNCTDAEGRKVATGVYAVRIYVKGSSSPPNTFYSRVVVR